MPITFTKKAHAGEMEPPAKVATTKATKVTMENGVPTVHKVAVPIEGGSKPTSKKKEAKDAPVVANIVIDGKEVGLAEAIKLINCIDKSMVTAETTATKQPIEMHITTTKKKGQDHTSNYYKEQVGEVIKKPDMCSVGFKLGGTTNTGNFENLRYDVTLNIPCEEKDIDATFEKAKEWVDAKLCSVVSEIEGS